MEINKENHCLKAISDSGFFAICEKKVTVGDMFEKNSVCNVTVILSQEGFSVTGKNYFISGGKNDVTD